ncbi:protein BatD [bacterium]|nr:protein BatD [bacterium]
MRLIVGFMSLMILLLASISVIPGTRAFAGTAAAVIDKTEGSLNDSFYVTLTITGKVKGSIEPPAIDGCETAQAGVSHNMQWINGEFSSEDQYTFVIQPGRAGTFTVPSWKLKVDGEDISTLPLKFQVTGGGRSAPAAPAAPGGGNQQEPGEARQGDEIFIERDVPGNDGGRAPYVGEAFVSTIRVFHKIQITSAAPKRDSSPEFRLIAVPGDKTYQRIVNGVRYQVIEFKETLIPLRAGTHTLPPYRMQATVMRPSQKMPGGSVFDFFSNQFFGGARGLGQLFGREETVDVQGKPVKVTVRDLPDAAPAGFSGLVGQFSISAEPSSREIAPGDSVTVSVIVEGLGALDTLDRLPGSFNGSDNTGYKVYPEKPSLKEEFVTAADGSTALRSRREFKFAVVPRGDSGRLELGRVTVPYFDPAAGKYQTLEADLGGVEVKSGAPRPASQAPQAAPAAPAERRKLPSGLITLLLAAAAAGVTAILWRRRDQWMIGGRRQARPEPDLPVGEDISMVELSRIDNTTSRGASATLFSQTRRLVDSGMLNDALVSLEHALREVISSRAGKRVDAMTPREIRRLIAQTVEAKNELELLEQVEALIFSQKPVAKDEILSLLDRSETASAAEGIDPK